MLAQSQQPSPDTPATSRGSRTAPSPPEFGRWERLITPSDHILEWFGHYLKGEPARPWIASGVTYLDREREVNAAKGKKGT